MRLEKASETADTAASLRVWKRSVSVPRMLFPFPSCTWLPSRVVTDFWKFFSCFFSLWALWHHCCVWVQLQPGHWNATGGSPVSPSLLPWIETFSCKLSNNNSSKAQTKELLGRSAVPGGALPAAGHSFVPSPSGMRGLCSASFRLGSHRAISAPTRACLSVFPVMNSNGRACFAWFQIHLKFMGLKSKPELKS